MAKIKIRGYSQFVEVENNIAKEAKKLFNDSFVPNDTNIDVGQISTKKGDISAIVLDEERKDMGEKHHQAILDYYKQRNEILRLSPAERATKSAKGHFILFYYGFYGKKPIPELIDRAVKTAEVFYQKNPDWAKPSMKCWFEMLPETQKMEMNANVFRILEQTEMEELKTIESNRAYFGLNNV